MIKRRCASIALLAVALILALAQPAVAAPNEVLLASFVSQDDLKPIIATDRGMFGYGISPARDQAERGKFYQEFAYNLLDNPVVIGEQWFEYTDEPLLGENVNHENFCVGFVSVADQPYAALADAARSVGATAYTRHTASK